MSKAKGGLRGRIPPRGRSSVSKARRARGFEILEQGDLGEVAFVHKAMSDPYAYYREAWHLLREPDGLTFG
jgi:hypothetical protein